MGHPRIATDRVWWPAPVTPAIKRLRQNLRGPRSFLSTEQLGGHLDYIRLCLATRTGQSKSQSRVSRMRGWGEDSPINTPVAHAEDPSVTPVTHTHTKKMI